MKKLDPLSDPVSLLTRNEAWGGGISYRCAAGPPHTHPLNVYWNMEKVYL